MNVLQLATNRMNEIKGAMIGLLKDSPNYKDEVVSLALMRNKWTWNEQLKSASYKITTKDLRTVESTNPFMGWSFVLI